MDFRSQIAAADGWAAIAADALVVVLVGDRAPTNLAKPLAAPLSDVTLASADYGEPLSAIVRQGNFWGTQFHPERSATVGARVLANFLMLDERGTGS